MKRSKFILILTFYLIFVLHETNASQYADMKNKVILYLGYGLSLNLPMLSYYNKGCKDETFLNKNDVQMYPWENRTYLQFGFQLGGDLGFLYKTAKSQGLGLVLNFGYSFGGGVHIYTDYRINGEYGEFRNDEVKQSLFSHSIYIDLNFAYKTNVDKSVNLVVEVGAKFLPTAEWTLDNNKYWIKEKERCVWYFYAGPDIYLGLDINKSKWKSFSPGLRFSATFASDTSLDYDAIRDYKQWIVRTKLMVALEFKMNYFLRR